MITFHAFGNFFTPTTELKSVIIEYDIEHWHFTHSQVRQDSKQYFPWSHVQNPQQAWHSEVNKDTSNAFLGVSRALGCNMGKSPFPRAPIFLRVLGAVFSSGHPKSPYPLIPQWQALLSQYLWQGTHLALLLKTLLREPLVLVSLKGISGAGNKYLCSNTCVCSFGVANVIGML